ncbi:DUF397 domain-containing protein [Nonomuraea sp. NPDC002799]
MEKVDLTAAVWRTSSLSGGNGQCVEVAVVGERIAVRDSKNRAGSVLLFTPDEWRAFTGGVRLGEFDLLS